MSLSLLVAMASPGAVRAYTYAEILEIYRMSGRQLYRNPALAQAMRLLRESRVLYLKSADVAALAAQVERPEILAALATLHDAGLLPQARTSADTIHVEKDLLTAEPPAKKTRPIYRAGRVRKPIPFYELIDFKNYYILGGMLPANTELEVVTAHREKVAMVAFEGREPAYIAMEHVAELAQPEFRARQSPAGIVSKSRVGSATWYRAVHEYAPGKRASLSILWVPLGGDLTVRPYVTGAYDLTAPGPTQVTGIDDMAAESGAVAAVNGTFFINAPAGRGKPLGPIVLDGRKAWSYDEQRVLKMNRAFLAVTADGRAVLGETDLPTDGILEQALQGRLLPGAFRGARLRHLIGGFGWLMRDGDELAWQRYAGTQFWYTYYSYYTKRPQTVMGVAPDGRGMVLIAQEGLPHSSRPMSLPMLSRYLKANFPVKDAVFLDGGGSTEMVLAGRPVTRQEHNGAHRRNSTAVLVVPRENRGERSRGS
ncbi:MAG: phosphodiester glycosidase family protein [Candidatus Wallbacteria bacterium]|nr:phosphodiester glycosidase family protein [Candidatus Wallbacteria bacterium]